MSPTLMDLPGTSPLVPHAHLSKDGRSFSLTAAYPDAPRLANNRSYASLRNPDAIQRPRSPYKYPTRLRRPNYRPASPALSETSGLHPRAYHGYSTGPRMRASPLPPPPPHEMSNMLYQHSNRSAPSVAQMPLPPMPSMPPMPYDAPPFPQRPVFRTHGSAPMLRPRNFPQSNTPNSRTVSSAPSSGPSSLGPTTPKGNASVDVLIRSSTPNGMRPLGQLADTVDITDGPAYYDYAEDFGKKPLVEEPSSANSSGFVNRIKAVLEERASGKKEQGKRMTVAEVTAEFVELPTHPATPDSVDAVELPASPIPKRITRNMILDAIDLTTSIHEPSTAVVEVEVKQQANPSESSSDTASVAEVELASSADGEEHTPRKSSESETTSGQSTMSLPKTAVNVSVKYGERARLSVSSSEGSTVKMIPAPSASVSVAVAPVGSQPESVSKASLVSGITRGTTTPARSSRPHSMFTLREPSADLGRLSIPASSEATTSTDISAPVSDIAVNISIPDNIASIDQPAATHAPVTVAAQPLSPVEEEDPQCIRDYSPAPSGVNFSTEKSSLGSATVQSTTIVSVSSRSCNSRDSTNSTTHLVWPIRKDSLKTPPPVQASSSRASLLFEDAVTDLRTSAARYPSQLSDVKEEPSEEASQQDLRTSRASSAFRFPAPRSSKGRVSLEEMFNSKTNSKRSSMIKETDPAPVPAPTPAPASVPKTNSKLAETRLIPSMNFSRMDLFSKLSEALDIEVTHSLDGEPDFEMPEPVNDRPYSLGPMREKYKSFFANLDAMEKDNESVKDLRPKTPEGLERLPAERKSADQKFAERKSGETIMTMQPLSPTVRPLSPEELLTEVERLAVPSVAGLTKRLSELLPSLRKWSSKEQVDEQADDQAIEEVADTELKTELQADVNVIRHVGDRPGILNNVRSSARLRPLPGSNVLVVVEDDVYEELTQRDKRFSGGRITEVSDSDSSTDTLKTAPTHRHPSAATVPPLAELEAPSAALIRHDGGSIDANNGHLPGIDIPWTENGPGTDIKFPAQAHTRDSPVNGPSRLRMRLSGDSSDAHDNGTITGTIAAGSDTTETHDTFRALSSKRGTAQKAGVLGTFDNSGFPLSPDAVLSEDSTHDPGDRYPTTGLSPPAGLNLDSEGRSFFSDNSSETRHARGFRKRLTKLRSRAPAGPRGQSATGVNSIEHVEGSRDGSETGPGASVQSYNGTVGMSKVEFRAKRFVARIKFFWFRGGELFRTMSGRRRNTHQEAHEWLQDEDVYSGT
ncbi:hypothetical protein K490DRAFT_66804 [Saccharata proteae CBS 121410]|uniref:Uncharacterized protein n=1 Tax=Saccharata proteae CBS 121410 TaxID=1314787 RepID=A0A9P4HSW2_9PEZI|nr:hypothetical protein K490DRAFT_66804 [Saccharata proteae CBS 121410]